MSPPADPSINPFRAGLPSERTPQPCTMVIFGATGDLTARKLVPALYNLAFDQQLSPGFGVVGFARREWDDTTFKETMLQGINAHSRRRPADPTIWDEFSRGLRFLSASFEDAAGYAALARLLEEIEAQRGAGHNRIFYLATPPSAYAAIIRNLGQAGLVHAEDSGHFSRIIVEKPFGRDLRSAQDLNAVLASVFREDQVYRIDHYLGKETVQNILVLRFANGIFEPIWNQKYVDHVQITAAESLGMEGRGRYFEEAGILRDMVQNHMMQLLCMTAMEPPVAFSAGAVRDEKVKVLHAIRMPSIEEVPAMTLRGQFTPGSVGGTQVPGFTQEAGVSPDSRTETYVALRLAIDNWRWAGVPFYLRTGKRLPRRVTEIAIQFKSVPHLLFRGPGAEGIESNVLAMRIQPDEGIALKFGSKVPGPTVRIRTVTMDFRYGTSFGAEPPEAYERLLLDCLLGDGTLFTRRDEVEAAWAVVSRIHEGWAAAPRAPLPGYEAGSWGPVEADAFIGSGGREWRRP
jgi:glucose-6-phosphate 1-dehydrogenase